MATAGSHALPSPFAPPSGPAASTLSALQQIAQGAEALLYRTTFLWPARHAILKHRATKPYRHPVLDRRLTRQRVLAEARTLVRLRREGVPVPGVLACDWDGGWLLLEFVPGRTVRACLDRYLDATTANVLDARSAPELCDLMMRVGRAVGRMHAVGVVHGDLTTSNLLLRRGRAGNHDDDDDDDDDDNNAHSPLDGAVTIIDFGLATATVQDEERAVDLYVLERAFGSTHPAAEPLFARLLCAYGESYAGAGAVLRRLVEVRMRGRKRSMLG